MTNKKSSNEKIEKIVSIEKTLITSIMHQYGVDLQTLQMPTELMTQAQILTRQNRKITPKSNISAPERFLNACRGFLALNKIMILFLKHFLMIFVQIASISEQKCCQKVEKLPMSPTRSLQAKQVGFLMISYITAMAS